MVLSQEQLSAITRNPAQAEAWLTQIEGKGSSDPSSENVLTIADYAQGTARDHLDTAWAKVAVHAYELRARLVPEFAQSAVDKAMKLRGWFIAKLGPKVGDNLLDPTAIKSYFLDNLPYSLEETHEKLKQRKNKDLPLGDRLPIEEIRKLRAIKNRLVPVKQIADCDVVPADPQLRNWLAIQEDLP